MKYLLIIFLFSASFVSAQEYEYWNPEDFDIGRKEIGIGWKEYAFNWQIQSDFNLPDGTFLNGDPTGQKKQVDMLAAMDEINRKKNQYTPNFESPLSIPKREKKSFEVQINGYERDDNNTYINPFIAPTLDRNYRFRNRSPFRTIYLQN